MNIKIIKYCFVFLIIFFSWVNFANANILINEFVSHPNSGDQEWIELINTSGSPVDLTGWKLTELSSPNTNPTENDLLSLSGTINTILVFEVGTSKLNDGGDSIGLYDGTTLIDRVTYGTDSTIKNYSINLTAPSIGKSGALISGSWVSSQDSTKNLPNSNSNNDTIENNADTTSVTTAQTQGSLSGNNLEAIKITTKIISPKTATVGIPFSLNSLTTTNRGGVYAVGKFVWNFGDGKISEVSNSNPFDYTYEYPGEYVVTLSYFNTIFSKVPDATSRVTIKVISSELYISSVGNSTDPFIELENKSNSELLLSGWVITAGAHYFNIPDGMTILPNKKIKLSPNITGFVGEDINKIAITDSSKEIIATYPTVKKSTHTSIATNNKINTSGVSLKNPQVINLNDLGADAGGSRINISNSIYPILGLIFIIGLGITSFLIMKKTGKVEDYMEKEVRAEDMRIIE